MSTIEKIKAEIERRKKENQWSKTEGADERFSEDCYILSLIETLEKEQDCLYGYSPENRFCDECSSKLCDARKEE